MTFNQQVSLSAISRWLFFIALTVVALLALVPQPVIEMVTLWDKANHFLAFFVLLWLMDYAWPNSLHFLHKVLLLLLFGMMIELAQIRLSRTFSLWDWLADFIGLVGYAVCRSHFLSLRGYIEQLPFIRQQIPLDGD